MNGLKKRENGGFWEGFIEEWENLTQEHYAFFELQFTIHEVQFSNYAFLFTAAPPLVRN